MRERKHFREGTEARESNTTIMTRHQMLVGDLEKTFTKRPKGYFHWKMAWWVIGLMNHWILNVATNVGLLRTHTRAWGSINMERNSLRWEYATIMRGNAVRARQSLTKGTKAWGSNTIITTTTPNVSRRTGENLHQADQGLPPLAKGLVGDRLNEPSNS